MKKKVRRPGSGRTKGAVSFVTVTLNELNDVLKPEANVLVSRRFAENVGISGKPFSATTKNITTHASIVDVKVNDLQENEAVTFAKTEW